MTNNIKLSLLENAESFAIEGIEAAIRAETNSREWKFAILHIVQAIELVLKEILRREHDKFIYENIDNPKNTVSLRQALIRISKVSKIRFSAKDIKKVNSAVDSRNKFTHNEIEYNSMQMKSVFADMFGFLQHCYSSFLGKHLSQSIPDDLWHNVIDIEKYVKILHARLKDMIKDGAVKENDLCECPICSIEAFHICKNECLICGYKAYVDFCHACKSPLFFDSSDCGTCEDDYICDECLDDKINNYIEYQADLMRGK